MTGRKNVPTEHEEVMQVLKEIKTEQELVRTELSERRYLDAKTKDHDELINGNGKPGLRQIRDMVLSWQTKINGITLLIIGDIILQIVRFAFGK